ncbi:MCE family protein [Acidiferrimicrobium sp. IK]|uniref:MCE family protein n=1 Tax=Acidiferrimicrobium sp. IK TaxID=2871700 RepID=UPI0021CB5142|nr:MlaD family protein [Acidiferrimicrobium sp. IK]MCU4184609.1 MCE family protein [Acidiferrimicrobium sp. IK]
MFAIVSVTITISVVASLLDLKIGQPSTSYHADFTNASGLEAGDIVRIAGVEVGKVTGVAARRTPGGYQARADFTVLASQHLTTTTRASIRFENLLGQRYLGLAPGAPGGAALRSGATIPASRTSPGLDLTSVFNGFQPLLAALDPAQVNQLTGSIIAVLQGQAGSVSNLVSETASVTSNLVQHQAVIDQVLANLTPLLTSVNTHDTQLGQLIDGFDALAQGLAGQRDQLGTAITSVGQLTSNVSGLLTQSQPSLDQDLQGLVGATSTLKANQDAIQSVIADLPPLLNTLDKVADSGSYLAVYVCDLTVQASGPISVKLSPTVPQSPALSVPTGPVGGPARHTGVCR